MKENIFVNYKIIYTVVFISFVSLVVIPVLYTLGTALFIDGSLSDNLLLLDKETLSLLVKSCVIAFSIALFSTLLGTVLGFLLYKTNIVFRGFFKIGFLLPNPVKLFEI